MGHPHRTVMLERLARRAASVPGLLAATLLTTLTLPLTAPLAALADRVARGRPNRLRLLRFVQRGLLIESMGVVATGWEWVRAGFGTRLSGPTSTARHYRLQQWWVRRLIATSADHLAFAVRSTPMPSSTGSVIVLSRHACIADALLPSVLYGDRRLGYVLKSGLQWGPCLDIVGNRLPNVFIDRASSDPAQRAAIAGLAERIGPGGGVVVFPEGTFHTAARAQRAQTRLADSDPNRAERLGGLRHVLPPRPGGVLAALDGDPEAEVHVIAHIGFEGMATMAELVRSVPLAEPVDVEVWRFHRSEIPDSRDDQVRWLDELWLRMDHWVDDARRRRR